MKKLFACVCVALVACSTYNPSSTNEEPASIQEAITDLPPCNSGHQGQVQFVATTNALMACVHSTWVAITIPQGPPGPPGSPGVCSCNQDAGSGDSGNGCPAPIPPSCQSGTFIPSSCNQPGSAVNPCYGTYYPPGSSNGNGGICGGGLVEGPGDGTNSCYCLPTGTGAPNSGCPLDGKIHYYVNGGWN